MTDKTPTIDDLLGLDIIHRTSQRIAGQFRMDMMRDEAKANLDARTVLFRCANRILVECGEEPITAEEVEGACILERECRGGER